MDSLPAMLIDENKALKARIEKLEEALMRIEIVADIERGDATDAHYAAMFTGIRETARDAIVKAGRK